MVLFNLFPFLCVFLFQFLFSIFSGTHVRTVRKGGYAPGSHCKNPEVTVPSANRIALSNEVQSTWGGYFTIVTVLALTSQ